MDLLFMVKSELVQLLASKQPHLSHSDVDAAVTLLINKMINVLASGRRVEIRGFGAFSLKHYKSKLGRNPRTGEIVSVPQRYGVHFKPGGDMKARVNNSAGEHKIVR
jgi:integration host factor subunit beta